MYNQKAGTGVRHPPSRSNKIMINSFKITTLLFGLLNTGLFVLWMWDINLMGYLFGVEVTGERNLIPFFFLALGLFSFVGSQLREERSRIMFLLAILVISFLALLGNLPLVLAGELKGMAFISTSFLILGLVSLWNERRYIDEIDNV